MEFGDELRNRTFAALRQEVLLKEDGRYVIYYSLPDEGKAAGVDPAGPHADGSPPDQQPWSPDREPHV